MRISLATLLLTATLSTIAKAEEIIETPEGAITIPITATAGIDYCTTPTADIEAYLLADPGNKPLLSEEQMQTPYLAFKRNEDRVAEYVAREILVRRTERRKGTPLAGKETGEIDLLIPFMLGNDPEIMHAVKEEIAKGKEIADALDEIDMIRPCREVIRIRKPTTYTHQVRDALQYFFDNSFFGFEPVFGEDDRLTHLKTWKRFSDAKGSLKGFYQGHEGINSLLESVKE